MRLSTARRLWNKSWAPAEDQDDEESTTAFNIFPLFFFSAKSYRLEAPRFCYQFLVCIRSNLSLSSANHFQQFWNSATWSTKSSLVSCVEAKRVMGSKSKLISSLDAWTSETIDDINDYKWFSRGFEHFVPTVVRFIRVGGIAGPAKSALSGPEDRPSDGIFRRCQRPSGDRQTPPSNRRRIPPRPSAPTSLVSIPSVSHWRHTL